MIPKIIHLCWLSGDPYPKLIKKCLRSWKKYLPDYEIILWDRNRFDINSCQWVKDAFEAKKYAFAADYIRCYALFNYGGIYLDSDVEVLKSFDDLIHLPYFLGYESGTRNVEAAVMGAEKGFPVFGKLLEYYQRTPFDTREGGSRQAIPGLLINLLQEESEDIVEISDIGSFNMNADCRDIQLFSGDFFSPISYCDWKTYFSKNTYCIHHFQLSWWSDTDRAINKLARKGKIGRVLQNNVIVQKAIGFYYKKLKTFKYSFFSQSFFIGLYDGITDFETSSFDFKDIRWIRNLDYGRYWYADPFILSSSDKDVVILAEEWVRKEKKGRLAVLFCEKRRNGYRLKQRATLLEKDTHLSFPYVIEDNGQIYVVPENYQSGTVTLYRYDIDANKLVEPIVLLNESLVNCQIAKIGKTYYMFGIQSGLPDSEAGKRLLIYKSDSLFGDYKISQTIDNKLREERGAGRIFSSHGRIYRPAQSCEGGYGKSVLIYELTMDENGSFAEKLSRRFVPDQKMHYGLKHHTFDLFDGRVAVDGNDFVRLYRIGRKAIVMS